MMIALATLRERRAAFVGSFVALTLGVAVLAATLVVFVSARPAVPDRLAAAAVVVQAPAAGSDVDTFEEYVPWPAEQAAALARDLAEIPGVTAAVPDRSFYAQPVRDGRPLGDPSAGDPLGHAWSTAALAPYRLVDGAPPAARGEVVLGTEYGFPAGDDVTLLTAEGPSTWTVTGTVDGPGVYLADSVAAAYAPGVTAIGLILADGADTGAVAAAARELIGSAGTVLRGPDRVALEPESDARTRWIGTQLLTVTVLLAAFATVFVMASTSALNAYQRRRELGLLRAVGATPRQVRRMLLGEALGVAVVAALVGAVLGSALAPLLGNLLVRAEMEPAGFTPRPSLLPVGAAVLTGIVVALLGAWSASRRAARVRPLEALREAAVDRRPMTVGRWILGGLAVAGGLGLAALVPVVDADASMSAALLSALALIVGLAALAPVAVPPVVRLLTAPLGRGAGATGMVVRESAVTAVRRTAATVAPVLLTVGFATLIFGMVSTASPAFGTADARAAGADAVVAPDGTPGLTDAAVAMVPGAVPPVLYSAAFAVDRAGTPVAVDVAGTDADGLVVGASVAKTHGWRAGDTAAMILADGVRETMTVTAVRPDGDLPSPVVLPRAVVRDHDPSALTPFVFSAGVPLSTDRLAGRHRRRPAGLLVRRRGGPAGVAVRARHGRHVGRLHRHRGRQHDRDGDRRPAPRLRRAPARRGDRAPDRADGRRRDGPRGAGRRRAGRRRRAAGAVRHPVGAGRVGGRAGRAGPALAGARRRGGGLRRAGPDRRGHRDPTHPQAAADVTDGGMVWPVRKKLSGSYAALIRRSSA